MLYLLVRKTYVGCLLGLTFLFLHREVLSQTVIPWGNVGMAMPAAATNNPVAVAAGNSHNLVLRADGTVVAWGSNSRGQINVPPTATNCIAVAASSEHNLALLSNGTVLAWGNNLQQQSTVPASATNIIDIAAGDAHSMALTTDGKVIAWGSDVYANVSLSTVGKDLIAIAAGVNHSLALRRDGRVIAWGAGTTTGSSPHRGQARVPRSLSNVVAIAAGQEHSVALRSDGRVFVWGDNTRGQTNVPAAATNVVAISARSHHTFALKQDGTVIKWGNTGNLTNNLQDMYAVAAGNNHGIGLKSDGSPRFFPRYSLLTSQRIWSVGDTLNVSAWVVGRSPLLFQWFTNDVPIPAPAGTNIQFDTFVGLNHDGVIFRVEVSNSVGVATHSFPPIQVRPLTAWGWDSRCEIPTAVTNTLLIAAGSFHSLAMEDNGVIRGWGKTADGRITIPASASNVVALAGGNDHSLALRDDGTVVAWGRNWDGQTTVPPTATNVVAIAAGWGHSLCLRGDGSVLAWGNNDYSQTFVPSEAMQAVAIAAGYYHNLALRADGRVVAWGLTNFVPSTATNIVGIAAGWRHSLAVTADGNVIAWGENSYGQCNVPADATNVVEVRAGYYHSVALRRDGSMVAWGKDVFNLVNQSQGLTSLADVRVGEDFNLALTADGLPKFGRQLQSVVAGRGGQAIINPLVQTAYPATFQWTRDGVAIVGATNRSLSFRELALEASGDYVLVVSNAHGQAQSAPINLVVRSEPATLTGVSAWGGDFTGQCQIPPTLTEPRALAAGAFHALALQADGNVVAWGKNRDGQATVPSHATNVIAIAAGNDHSLALQSNGIVHAWGRNWDGQCDVPATATNIVAISAGHGHSVALNANGQVLAWGNNDYNQTNTPALNDVISIDAGYYHTLALRANGKVVVWGLHETAPAGAANAVAISAGWQHSLALRADGQIVAWGDNSYGQLDVPPTATNIIAISAGYYHSMALRADGKMLVWGKNHFDITNVSPTLSEVVEIAAGEDYGLALRELGPVRIVQPPQPVAVHVGETAVFRAEVRGSPAQFQWSYEGAPLLGATSRFLALPNAQTNQAGVYELTGTNNSGLVAAAAPLTVLTEPVITSERSTTNVLTGAAFCLSAEVAGEPPFTFRWQLNGADLSDGPRFTGTTTGTLCVQDAQLSDGGDFALKVTSSFGAVTSLVAQVSVSKILAWGDNSSGQLQVPPGEDDVVALSAGDDHSLGLRRNGTMFAWGNNSFGQLNVPAQATNIMAVTAGSTYSVALTGSGRVIAWGDNSSGQTNVPITVTNAVAIAAGDTFAAALLADGRAVAWGSGPATVIPGAATNLIALIANDESCVGQRADGSLVRWGQSGALPAVTDLTSLSIGAVHAVAVRSDGTVLNSGSSNYGLQNVPATATNLVAVAAGDYHSLGLNANGDLFAWGDGSLKQTNVPNTNAKFTAIAAGGNYNLALLAEGSPWIAQAPQPARVHSPRPVLFQAKVTGEMPIAYQWYHSQQPITGATNPLLYIAGSELEDNGTYYLIASNAAGQISTAPVELVVQLEPYVTTPPQSQIILEGGSFCAQVETLGMQPQSFQWQLNDTNLVDDVRFTGTQTSNLCIEGLQYAEMGNFSVVVSNAFGSTTGLVAQLRVTDIVAWGVGLSTNVPLSATNVIAISGGPTHSLALRDDGTIITWGSTGFGLDSVPAAATNVIAIAAGNNHSLALRADDVVIGWGSASSGRNTVPASATNVVGIADGQSHALALRADGTVVGWGDNFQGKATPPADATNVVAIAAGGNHSLARRADGTLVAWGWNFLDSTTIPPSATNIVAIATGNNVSLVAREDGTPLAWGSASGIINIPATVSNIVDVAIGNSHALALSDEGSVFSWVSTVQSSVPPTATNVVAIAAGSGYSLALRGNHRARLESRQFEKAIVLGQPISLVAPPISNSRATYQWQWNGHDIFGATNRNLVIPYTTWTNAGIYRAIITDAFGTVTGPANNVSFLPPPLRFDASSDLALTPQGLRMRVLGTSGSGFVVLSASTDLVTWTPIYTNLPSSDPIEFIVPLEPGADRLFYRAAEVYPQ